MANKVQCAGGHWFDLSKFHYCPFCGMPAASVVQAPVQSAPVMQPQMQPVMQAQGMMPQVPQYRQPQMQLPAQGYYAQSGYYAPAVSAVPTADTAYAAPSADADVSKYLPVGWLVGVEGCAKGKTFVIRENRNFVGSGSGMDITINDSLVAKDRHAVITYVPGTKSFYAQTGMSRELYYVNGNAVLECTELHAGDIIEIGSSKLSLLPLCNESFGWDELS